MTVDSADPDPPPEPDWGRLLLEAMDKAVEDERFESHHRRVADEWEVLTGYEAHIDAGHHPRDALFEAVHDADKAEEVVRDVLEDELERRKMCGNCGGSGGNPPEHPCPKCGGSGRR